MLLLILPAMPYASDELLMYENNIKISINISESEINGSSTIRVQRDGELSIHRGSLEILYVRLNGQDVDYEEKEDVIVLPSRRGEIEIGFRGTFAGGGGQENVITDNGVSLMDDWYPWIEGLGYYSLEVALPEGYEAISEGEEVQRVEGEELKFYFKFSHPVDRIHLVAGNRFSVIKDTYNHIDIYAYFFDEDRELAEDYIEHVKAYIQLYEDMLGAFPYKRFSIVEHFLPTGYSMPTFTLLGSTVVKLPFIVETSLGHEILHQWFGDMVYVDYESGNWSEGLTTYLADHLYKERQGEGWEYRKRMLLEYKSYVNEENDFPLRDFRGRFDRASKAIGYGKSAMVFHMLRNLIGSRGFLDALRDFIAENRFRMASWDDLKTAFERHHSGDLGWFFRQWIDGRGLPEIRLADVRLRYVDGGYELEFKLAQDGQGYRIDVPVTIYSGGKGTKRFFALSEEERVFRVYMSERPERVVLDEDYDIARWLDDRETPPLISGLLGGGGYLIVTPVEGDERYEPAIRFFKERGGETKRADEIEESDIKTSAMIILGAGNPLIKRLYGRVGMAGGGFEILIKKNPWNESKVVCIIDGDSKGEIEQGIRKIAHYGRYSHLVFKNGVNLRKETEASERGVVVEVYKEPLGVDLTRADTFSEIINKIASKKIVYVGEFHDEYAHHITQLEIIRALYERNRNIAIGMEMFQRPFQDVLDEYTGGRIDEREFLKASEYYKRWRFDYNLYKPILDFAVSKGIPVIGLNIKAEIIDKVSEGGMDSLTDEERAMLPKEMDFSDSRYRQRLLDIFKQHKDWQEKNFDYFYQSQIIWDETMAESIDRFLKKNPGYQMVVIAGQGHLEYGSGIPKRAYRRNGYDYAIVLLNTEAKEGIADYILFPEELEAPSSPRLMVFLSVEEGEVRITGFPEDSVSKKAGLREGDVILSLDDEPVHDIEDIRLALFYKEGGDIVRVKVRRGTGEDARELYFNIRLR
jgi:uncharacterized iron-regulated protein